MSFFKPEDFEGCHDENHAIYSTANAHPKLKEMQEALEEAKKVIEFCLSQTMLPHQITHDELEMSCNKAVSSCQTWLKKYSGEG